MLELGCLHANKHSELSAYNISKFSNHLNNVRKKFKWKNHVQHGLLNRVSSRLPFSQNDTMHYVLCHNCVKPLLFSCGTGVSWGRFYNNTETQMILLSKKQNLETSFYLQDIFNKSNSAEDFCFYVVQLSLWVSHLLILAKNKFPESLFSPLGLNTLILLILHLKA